MEFWEVVIFFGWGEFFVGFIGWIGYDEYVRILEIEGNVVII